MIKGTTISKEITASPQILSKLTIKEMLTKKFSKFKDVLQEKNSLSIKKTCEKAKIGP